MQPISQKLRNAFGITATWPQIRQTQPLKSATQLATKWRKTQNIVSKTPSLIKLSASPKDGAENKKRGASNNSSTPPSHYQSINTSTIIVHKRKTHHPSANTSTAWKLTVVVPNNKKRKPKPVPKTGSMERRSFLGRKSSNPPAVIPPLVTNKLCDAEHDGRLIMRRTIELQVDVLFNMLFSSTSSFLIGFHASRNSTDLKLGDWKSDKGGKQVRVVNVTMALQANVGPKTARVTETHTMRACTARGELYSIDVESVNEGIPYADVFTIATHYCLSRSSSNSTDMVVFANVNFIKSTWAVVKAFIVKHTYEGLEEFFQAMNKELEKEELNAKKKLLPMK